MLRCVRVFFGGVGGCFECVEMSGGVYWMCWGCVLDVLGVF